MIVWSGHAVLQCNNLNEGKRRWKRSPSDLSTPCSSSQRPCNLYTKQRCSYRVKMLSMVLLLKVMRMDVGRWDLFIRHRKCRCGYAHFNNDALFRPGEGNCDVQKIDAVGYLHSPVVDKNRSVAGVVYPESTMISFFLSIIRFMISPCTYPLAAPTLFCRPCCHCPYDTHHCCFCSQTSKCGLWQSWRCSFVLDICH